MNVDCVSFREGIVVIRNATHNFKTPGLLQAVYGSIWHDCYKNTLCYPKQNLWIDPSNSMTMCLL